jgi:hypothetical protein
MVCWDETWNDLPTKTFGKTIIGSLIWAVPRTSEEAKYQQRDSYLIKWKGEWKVQPIPEDMVPEAIQCAEITSIKPVIALFL